MSTSFSGTAATTTCRSTGPRSCRRGRSVAIGKRADLLPGRGQPPYGQYRRDQQGGHGRSDRHGNASGSRARGERRCAHRGGCFAGYGRWRGAHSGQRVLVVEDGPTLTHGDMRFGAGTVLARKFGAAEIIDPRPFAVGSIADTYNTYRAIGRLLSAMGTETPRFGSSRRRLRRSRAISSSLAHRST